MDIEQEELRAFICKPITEEESEVGYRGGVEAWRTEVFDHFWSELEEEAFGSQVEIRYAVNFDDLKSQLDMEDPAPNGMTFYTPYYHKRAKRIHRGEDNRLYRSRYPIVESSDSVDILEVVQREKKVLIYPSVVVEVFPWFEEEVGDWEHVAVVSDTCVMKPQKALNGPMFLVYNPKQVKQLRTKDKNDLERKRKREEKHEREQKEKEERRNREEHRKQLSFERKKYLKAVLLTLLFGLKDLLKDSKDIVTVNMHTRGFHEIDFVRRICWALEAYKHVMLDPAEVLDPSSAVFRRLRKHHHDLYTIKAGKLLGKLISKLNIVLSVYPSPRLNRKFFPEDSGIYAEEIPDHPQMKKIEDGCALRYIQCYVSLRKITEEIRDRRKRKQARSKKKGADAA